ncbi:hypothetical protein N7535_006105 [Penicillium sp. DV-2018c]|nr:hypothetical protein N7535_006105 [Penicillium sp. DV-2018c]
MAPTPMIQPLQLRRRSSSQKKRMHRPPPLKIKNIISPNVEPVTIVRGSMSSLSSISSPNKELPTVPVQHDRHRGHRRDHSGTTPSPATHMAPDIKENPQSQPSQSQKSSLKENDHSVGETGDSRSTSPSRTRDTMIPLDSPQDSEDDSEISSLSSGPSLQPSALRLSRFFPELSSHFSVVSPVSASSSANSNMDRSMGPSIFERELEERVQKLYRSSTDAAPADGFVAPPRNSKSSSEEISDFDCASSCYSSRSSITTVDSEFWGEDPRFPYKTADDYSIFSPVEAGVFDDAASIVHSRSASASPSRLHKHHRPSQLIPGPIRKVSMTDVRNKPLPLEPSHRTRVTPRRYSDSPLSAAKSPRSTIYSQNDWSVAPLRHSATVNQEDRKHDKLHKLLNDSHPCHSCGHSQPPPQPQPRHARHRSELMVAGHRARHIPTLSRAAEEVEDALAGLTDKDWSQKTLLIVDGPLQISRNDGALVATRPAPLPPSAKPHSRTPRATPRAAFKKYAQYSMGIGKSPTKQSGFRLSMQKSRDKLLASSTEAKINTKDSRTEGMSKKDKSKKFFSAFARKQNQEVRDVVSTGSRSEDSLPATVASSHSADPQDPAPTRDSLLLKLPRLLTNDLISTPIDNVAEKALSSSLGPGALEGAESDKPFTPKLRQNWALVSTAQASSVKIPDQIYELPATTPSLASALPAELMDLPVHVTLPEDMPMALILSIMERIDALDDLFNFALVSKKTYTAFKSRELPLLKNTLFKMSPPAWELREMSPPWEMEWQLLVDPDSQVPEYTPTIYLQRYAQDIYTLAKLKSLVLARCVPFLRRDTVRGLAGVDSKRAEEVDDAFWRVWSFCRIFGCGKGRENDIAGQMDWLKGGVEARSHVSTASTMTQPFGINNVLFEPPEGFGHGNLSGLSQKQMYDMIEIWTCMGVLLQPLHGKCAEAREVGIFNGMEIPEGDLVREEKMLEEWTSYILTLGLGAVLTLSAVCPADTTLATFQKAQAIGLTKWELTETEATRSSFLKEAISRAYELQERSLNTNTPTDRTPISNSNSNSPSPVKITPQHRQRQTNLANELRTRRAAQEAKDKDQMTTRSRFSFSTERPMSEFSTIMHDLDSSSPSSIPQVPVLVPTLIQDRSSTSTADTDTDRDTAPLTPTYPSDPSTAYATYNTSGTLPAPLSVSAPAAVPVPIPGPLRPQVLDPVDKAIDMIVNELGFAAEDAKWALKITDTGEGIDARAAVQLLQREWRRNERNLLRGYGGGSGSGSETLLSSVIERQKSQGSGWRWA